MFTFFFPEVAHLSFSFKIPLTCWPCSSFILDFFLLFYMFFTNIYIYFLFFKHFPLTLCTRGFTETAVLTFFHIKHFSWKSRIHFSCLQGIVARYPTLRVWVMFWFIQNYSCLSIYNVLCFFKLTVTNLDESTSIFKVYFNLKEIKAN